jgi:hypothetical protein
MKPGSHKYSRYRPLEFDLNERIIADSLSDGQLQHKSSSRHPRLWQCNEEFGYRLRARLIAYSKEFSFSFLNSFC